MKEMKVQVIKKILGMFTNDVVKNEEIIKKYFS